MTHSGPSKRSSDKIDESPTRKPVSRVERRLEMLRNDPLARPMDPNKRPKGTLILFPTNRPPRTGRRS